MKILHAILVSAAISVPVLGPGTFAFAQDNDAAAAKVDKTTFVNMAASSNMLEIQSSEMALERASSEDVKAFANQMIQDHTKATQEMTAVLEKEGMTPPKDLQAKHAEMLKALGDNTSNFDAAYIELQRTAHQEAVGLFESYSSNPDDEALGAFAQKTLPTLQMHLEHAMKLDAGN